MNLIRHPSELEPRMVVPYIEIERFNTWASLQITDLLDRPSEMERLESVLYAIPITERLNRADYVKAVESARFAPNVPMSVYSAFKQHRFW